ncbi:MAG: M17 family peptidase N-terminal domain-containing protein, partial [Gemmatimonadales bacterium]|nr:M17 family peptidase N-terminal domain-containing protein [Gemmatimonadales bacterium]
MKTRIVSQAFAQIETPLLAVAVPQGSALPGSLADLDPMLGRAFSAGDYQGKRDDLLLVYSAGKAQRILLVGIGKPGDAPRTAVRRAAAA